jgi:hypothetical protein
MCWQRGKLRAISPSCSSCTHDIEQHPIRESLDLVRYTTRKNTPLHAFLSY